MSNDDLGLGATLRAWRDRTSPTVLGRAPARGRRAPGLRREDLAELAGVSVDYIVRLEQGRATNPSSQVVSALARALQLTPGERDHLYRLAHLQPPGRGTISDHVPPGMQRILTRLGDAPAAVFAADWRMVWWNESWSALLGDPRSIPVEERSLVRSRFPTQSDRGRLPPWPVLSTNTETSDRAIVADLRRASGRYPDDPRLSQLIDRTLQGNPRFADLWQEAAVTGHAEDRKTVRHPTVGEVTVDCDVLVDTDTDLKVVIYTAQPGSEDATKLDLVRVAGSATPGWRL